MDNDDARTFFVSPVKFGFMHIRGFARTATIWAFDWYQNRWPWMTLNGVMAVTLRYFTEFGKPALQKTMCGGIYARVYCILVRVQCRRKESSRSLSHLVMSFLLSGCEEVKHRISRLSWTSQLPTTSQHHVLGWICPRNYRSIRAHTHTCTHTPHTIKIQFKKN